MTTRESGSCSSGRSAGRSSEPLTTIASGSGSQAGQAALLAARGVAHEAPVALDAQRAGADHDRVDARAQRVEELAVGDARDRRGAPVDGGAAVGRVDHVHRDVRALRARQLPRAQLADELVGGQLAGLGQQPAQRDGRLVARRRVTSPGGRARWRP